AADRAEQLRRRAPRDPAMLFFSACAYALGADTAAGVEGRDAALRERYAGLALDTLAQAVACGYRDVTALRTDPDLDPVRGEPRFQDVLRQLDRRGPPADLGNNPAP